MHKGAEQQNSTRAIVVEHVAGEWAGGDHEKCFEGYNPSDGRRRILAERYCILVSDCHLRERER